ncbi:hypothetical protein KBK19_17235 [Microvirga sp. STR05]|uniref:Cthe-2314-like HEPN domain-containing protein n=1 Tax=Hymenobacter duratus TaxID=2771356 RepID=A0ABR8JN36_9BACT|nr:hypothetical protein [Hymenobacter duratus]MBD2716792.1 hypothetical protein [Hymenobacter duratus]MBR7951707.1 hypothetical protein [Microvirga sp. STR05]
MSTKKKPVNAIDNLIDAVAGTILQGKNSDLFLREPENLRLLDFFIRHIADLQNFIGLFKTHYLPAANKSTVDARKQVASSKYKSFFDLTDEDLKENVYETVRLGYVGLYHKLEIFVEGVGNQRSVIKETYLEDDEEYKFENIFKFLHSEFGLLRTDLKKDINPKINRIRLICNKVKHDDGIISGADDKLVLSNPIFLLDKGRRLRLPAEVLFADANYIKDFMKDVFILINLVSVYYRFSKGSFAESKEGEEHLANLKTSIKNYVDLLRK